MECFIHLLFDGRGQALLCKRMFSQPLFPTTVIIDATYSGPGQYKI